MSDKLYSAAKVWFLDRESQTEKVGIMYPITKIELLQVHLDKLPQPQVIYEAQPDGSWKVVGP